jgi:uncharacterized membrane protein YebE (DUF533 family)
MGWIPKVPWDEIEKYLEDSSEGLFQSIFTDMESVESDVRNMVDKDIDVYRDKVAEEIIAQAAQHTMMIGGGAALPDLLPIGGWPMLIASIGTDFALTMREEVTMLLKLAYLYGRELSREERQQEALGLLKLAGEGKLESAASIEPSKLLGLIGTKHISKKILVELGTKLGMRFYKKKLVALIPGIGILLSGGVNYFSTRKIGEYAQQFYQARARSGRWGDASPIANMDAFERCFLQVMVNLAKVDKLISKDEMMLLKDSMLMFGLGDKESKVFLKQLEDHETMAPIDAQDIKGLSREDRRYILKQGLHMIYADRKKTPEEASYLEVLSRKFEVPASLVEDLEREVKKELGIR